MSNQTKKPPYSCPVTVGGGEKCSYPNCSCGWQLSNNKALASANMVELEKVVELINTLIYKDADNDLKIGFNQGITTIREHLNDLKNKA